MALPGGWQPGGRAGHATPTRSARVGSSWGMSNAVFHECVLCGVMLWQAVVSAGKVYTVDRIDVTHTPEPPGVPVTLPSLMWTEVAVQVRSHYHLQTWLLQSRQTQLPCSRQPWDTETVTKVAPSQHIMAR